jgi:hypothetical protein
MTPDFALTLSHQGITLLQRGGEGWLMVGSVRLEDPDMAANLAGLRARALDLARGAPLASKLVLPGSQILYTTAQATGTDDIADSQQVADALEGATPYALADLVYDWVRQGDVLHIAAVARETLDEAEDFAAEHRFEPVCFVAAPEDDEFPGEPWFGETAMALDVLPSGESIDRDGDPVRFDPVMPAAPATRIESPAPEVDEPAADQPEADAPATDPAPVFMSIRAARSDAPGAPLPALADQPQDMPDIPPSIGPVPTQADTPEDTSTPVDHPAPVSRPAPQAIRAATRPAAAKAGAQAKTGPIAPARAAHTPPANDEEAMTVFGARKPQQAATPVRKVAMAAAVVLMGVIGAAAYWSFGPAPTGTEPGTPPDVGQVDSPATADDPQSETAPERIAHTAPAPAETELAAAPPPDPSDGPRVADSAAVGLVPAQPGAEAAPTAEKMDPAVARTAYASTGIWQRAPEQGYVPPDDALDDLYIASIDPTVGNQDAFSLPDDVPAADGRPRVPAAPRHPEDKTVLGPDGLVVPTPTGTLSPGGVRIFLGQPFVVPPSRPDALAEVAPVSPGSSEDPLAGFRPLQRPSGLIETNEKAVLGGRTLVELGRLRPVERPRSLQETARELEAAERMADSETAAGQAVEDAVAAAVAADFAGATSRAVETSPDPRGRPSNMAQLADRARRLSAERVRKQAEAEALAASVAQQAATQRAQASAQQQRQTAAAEAKRQEEAAKAAAAASAAEKSNSKGPAVARNQRLRVKTSTPASVARQATLKNAISLNKVALIGVYGTTSQRRALVRLPSGRYEKVSVGDRIDGGRVSAIGQSDLRYTKSGRNVTIKMPKG